MSALKKLNLSGNEMMGGQAMQQILRGLKSHSHIEDLDISKTGIGSDIICMQLLGELI